MRTMLDHLNLRLPIWNAGMGGGMAGPALVAAVCEAGGLGVLGAGSAPGALVSVWLDEIRALCSRPFGANIILPMSDGSDIEACFNARVPVLVLFWGDAQPYVKDAHRRDMFVVAQCGGPEDAVAAADAGVDAVIVQGVEAGGHVKALAPLSETLAATVKALGPLPVIAAGGIANGAGIAEVLAAGAQAASLGTRFVASDEADAFHDYKQRIVAASAADTVMTTLFDIGWPNANHRVIRNATYERWESAGKPASGARPGERDEVGELVISGQRMPLQRYCVIPPLKAFDGDLEAMPLYAGHSVDGIHDIAPAADIMARLHDELRRAVN
ncbi:MAG: nitronate monooxygenase [Proteobacteria bacterium]|nr:nitronate monooxygenase [Pseudomonadota bacterium]